MREQEKIVHKGKSSNDNPLYKGRYHIVFYDKDDETYITGFNTILEICRYKKEKVTSTKIHQLNVELYRALKREGHTTKMLNGQLMHVYLIDMTEDD